MGVDACSCGDSGHLEDDKGNCPEEDKEEKLGHKNTTKALYLRTFVFSWNQNFLRDRF